MLGMSVPSGQFCVSLRYLQSLLLRFQPPLSVGGEMCRVSKQGDLVFIHCSIPLRISSIVWHYDLV